MKDWRAALGVVPPPLPKTVGRAWVWYRNGPHWRADNAWLTMPAPEYVYIQGEGPLPQPPLGEGPQSVSLEAGLQPQEGPQEAGLQPQEGPQQGPQSPLGERPQEAGLQPQREPQPQRERCCSRRRPEPQPRRRRRDPQPPPEPSRSSSLETERIWAKREMHRAAGVAYVKTSADYRAVAGAPVARPPTPDPTVRGSKREWERGMQDWRRALERVVLVHNLTAPEDVDEDLRTAVRTALRPHLLPRG